MPFFFAQKATQTVNSKDFHRKVAERQAASAAEPRDQRGSLQSSSDWSASSAPNSRERAAGRLAPPTLPEASTTRRNKKVFLQQWPDAKAKPSMRIERRRPPWREESEKASPGRPSEGCFPWRESVEEARTEGFGYGHSKRPLDDGDRPTDASAGVAAVPAQQPPTKLQRTKERMVIKIEDDEEDQTKVKTEMECCDEEESRQLRKADQEFLEAWDQELRARELRLRTWEAELKEKATKEIQENLSGSSRSDIDDEDTTGSPYDAVGASLSPAQASIRRSRPKPSRKFAPSVVYAGVIR